MIRGFSFVVLAIAMVTFAPNVYAAPIVYTATLNGSSEVPPTGSTATGSAEVDFDISAHTMDVHITFSGLLGGSATAAHIHAVAPAGATAGVAVPFTGFPGATSGTYDHVFDTSSTSTYNATFVTNEGGTATSAEAALAAALAAGDAYVNIHDAQFPAGEIRGQLAAVPEPTTSLLLGSGLLGLVGLKRKVSGK